MLPCRFIFPLPLGTGSTLEWHDFQRVLRRAFHMNPLSRARTHTLSLFQCHQHTKITGSAPLQGHDVALKLGDLPFESSLRLWLPTHSFVRACLIAAGQAAPYLVASIYPSIHLFAESAAYLRRVYGMSAPNLYHITQLTDQDPLF